MKSHPENWFDIFQSPLGLLFLVFSRGRLAEIGIREELPNMPKGKSPAGFPKQLTDYFAGRLTIFEQEIHLLSGTAFEQKVWLALQNIPYGETRTYKWLAEQVGSPKAVRAVGQALGRNPLPIVLPCHRIIESDGSIGGYSSGVDIKRRLLDLEYYTVIGRKMAWLKVFAQTVLATCIDVLPIAAVIIGFRLLVIRRPLAHPKKIAIGFAYVLLGIAFFLEGLKMALFPLGKMMASQLTTPEFLGIVPVADQINWRDYKWIYLFAGSLGFTTAFAEPSLLAVALKAQQISGGTIGALGLRLAVSTGVGLGIALGTFRIVTGIELYYFMVSGIVRHFIQLKCIYTLVMVVGFSTMYLVYTQV